MTKRYSELVRVSGVEVVTSYIGGEPLGPPAVDLSARPDSDALRGDGDAVNFETVYGYHKVALLALAVALTGNRSVAEDLTQEAFLRLHQKWGRVARYDDIGAWLRRVLLNLATSRRRRLAVEARALFRLNREPRSQPMFQPNVNDFWAEVRALPRRQAQTLVLFYMEDRSTGEVAAILGCAEGTVRALLHQGRQTLRRGLELGEDSDD
jgi:RNA polymerase sigma-70 factor (ECF subfamily)